MPGILGFCGVQDQVTAEGLLPAMIRALGDDASCLVDTWTAPGIGLGRVHLDLIDRAAQPLWSDDGNLALVMAGEIFSWDEFAGAPSADRPGQTGAAEEWSNARLLLAAYERWGEEFPQHVNGSFVAAFWLVAEQTLLLITDHIGTYPLYYAESGRMLAFGSGARVAALLPGLPRRVELAAVAEMVAFEHVYGDKTLFAGVKLLLPGSILRFAEGALRITNYIDFQYPETYAPHPEDFYVEQWAHVLRQAVARQAQPPFPLGVLLTGGLDSRSLLGMLHQDAAGVVALTFGVPDCDDLRIAREVAGLLGVPHTYVPMDPAYLAQWGSRGVQITDGMKSCVHFNLLGPLAQLVQKARVLYKGFLGGTLQGHVVRPDRLAPLRSEDALALVFSARNHPFPAGEWTQLYTAEMWDQVQSLPRQALQDALARSQSDWSVDKDSYIDLYQEDVRFTLLGVELARSQALVRVPMADQDYIRFSVSVPPGFRQNKHYYKVAIARAFPALAKTPVLPEGRPLAPCWRSLRLQAEDQARWFLRNRGVSWLPVRSLRPYAHYGEWLRRQLRPWLEQTLLSKRSLQRPYFRPEYIQWLVHEHLAGSDHTRRLGVLLTLELWHQQFLD